MASLALLSLASLSASAPCDPSSASPISTVNSLLQCLQISDLTVSGLSDFGTIDLSSCASDLDKCQSLIQNEITNNPHSAFAQIASQLSASPDLACPCVTNAASSLNHCVPLFDHLASYCDLMQPSAATASDSTTSLSSCSDVLNSVCPSRSSFQDTIACLEGHVSELEGKCSIALNSMLANVYSDCEQDLSVSCASEYVISCLQSNYESLSQPCQTQVSLSPSSHESPIDSLEPTCSEETILAFRRANSSVEISRIRTRSSNASPGFWTQRTRRSSSPKAAGVSLRDIRPAPQSWSKKVQSLLQMITTMKKTRIRSQLPLTSSPLSHENFKSQSLLRNLNQAQAMRSPVGREARMPPLPQMLNSRMARILCSSSKGSMTGPQAEAPAIPQALPLVRLSCFAPLIHFCLVAIISVCVGVIFALLAALLYTQRRGVYSEDDMPTVKGYWRAPSIQASLYDDSTHSEGAVVFGEGGLEMEVCPTKITSGNFRPDCPSEVRI